jgi:hypothetical protein
MATYKNGILGMPSGMVGQVVFSSWKGIPVIRSKPIRKKTGRSVLQIQQSARFVLLVRFLRPLNDLLNQTFVNSAPGMTCFNRAISENKLTITGNYPDIGIDYTQIVLTEGRLPLGEPPVISSPEAGKLLLSWKTGDGISRHLTNGSAFIAAYCEEFRRWIFSTNDIGEESTGCALDVSPFSGKPVQTYAGFITKGNKRNAESRYMGVVNVQ